MAACAHGADKCIGGIGPGFLLQCIPFTVSYSRPALFSETTVRCNLATKTSSSEVYASHTLLRKCHPAPCSASVALTKSRPPLELQNYHILGRILHYVPYHSPPHPGRVLTTFGFVSSIVEALNGWGASYSVNQSLSGSGIIAGRALIKTLILQLGVLDCFGRLAGAFYWRCHSTGAVNSKLKSSLIALYTNTCLILARMIHRTVEYFGPAEYRFTSSLNQYRPSSAMRCSSIYLRRARCR
jgi:hypothetical protein